tara:strand:+ start:9586 stop:9777 length:192 start_codon:yes stop_codon:yes gene_type:complete
MKTGDAVKYLESAEYGHLTGNIKMIHGRKWITISWSDGINIREHVDDLIFEREGAKRTKRESK